MELVLPVSWERGVQPSVLRSAWCWETGLAYLGCRVPQGVPISQTSHIPPLSASASPCATSGAGESCLVSVQLTVTGKPIKALEFFSSLVFYKVTS